MSDDHTEFCKRCEQQKNATYADAERARQRGDTAEHERLCKKAENFDIEASNDFRARHGLPPRPYNKV
jgi:hypothetical protein